MNRLTLFQFAFLLLFAFLMPACEYQSYSQGESLYKFYCASCHMEDGSGLKSLIPPLANSDYLKDNQSSLPCLIKNGIKGPITVNGKIYDTEMVGIGNLNDVQINNIINFINHAWENDYGTSNVREVGERLAKCNPE